MKKILFIAPFILTATLSWYLISGFVNHSPVEDALRKKIQELEKQLAADVENAATCNYKYFDTETALAKFIAQNYNSDAFNYTTVAANTNNLKAVLNTFPANSTVYVSVIYTSAGRDLRLSKDGTICSPFSVCCPPNCKPPKPSFMALQESFNPYK